MAVDTLAHLLALHITPANADDRAEVERMAKAIQVATDESVEIAFVDQGYTGERPAAAAKAYGIELEVVKLLQAKRDFVLLPRRWVVERSFAWATRFRRLVKDYERYASTLADLPVWTIDHHDPGIESSNYPSAASTRPALRDPSPDCSSAAGPCPIAISRRRSRAPATGIPSGSDLSGRIPDGLTTQSVATNIKLTFASFLVPGDVFEAP